MKDIKEGEALPARTFKPDEVQLFMYNAAIWNPHRIHYDAPYTTEVEGHPGIVIDGPLQGDWLTQLVLEWIDGAGELVEFRYSNRRAAYLGETLRAEGRVEVVDPDTGDVRLTLAVVNEQGQTNTPGEAVVRFRPESGRPAN
ncbi:hypothetical protein H0Z60_14050 [Ectothiorhodospiraceae bacterium WFHF3C12]|nr:hypothetical protein [Ectothiorhodospiraceae bacterium WFHF3C12]